MLLTFDFSSDTPLYIQLRNQIIIGIADGRRCRQDLCANLFAGSG